MFVKQFSYQHPATATRAMMKLLDRPVYFLLNDVVVPAFKRYPDDKRAVRVQRLDHKQTNRQTDIPGG